MRYTYMNTFKAKNFVEYQRYDKKNHIKWKKHMEDNFFDSVKTISIGILKDNDTPKIEYVPKQKSVQMIRCSICGRKKEIGGICKRCKTC